MKGRKKERDHNNVLKSLKLIKGVSQKQLVTLHHVFGPRLQRALEILHQKQVIKYIFEPSGKTIWLVEGKGSDYLIYEKAPYCSCKDFYISIINGEAAACKHLVAQRMAEVTGWYRTVTKRNSSFRRLMNLWRGQVFNKNESPLRQNPQFYANPLGTPIPFHLKGGEKN
jgi:predicted nucleic acid-binding Zn finger protein